MSRNMVVANSFVFASLDNHCAAQGYVLANAGRPRWVESRSPDKYFIKRAALTGFTKAGPNRLILRFDLDVHTFVCCVGMPLVTSLSAVPVEDPTPGQIVTILFEGKVQPTATISEVRQYVEATDLVIDPLYGGHLAAGLLPLYSSIGVITLPPVAQSETYKLFFLVALQEASLNSWMEMPLVQTLTALCELDSDKIPYETLFRSVFDNDPSTLFMALYRCLEAVYAYDAAVRLKGALSITADWPAIAIALEEEIGWYPREEGSLKHLMTCGSTSDLKVLVHRLTGVAASEDATAVELARLAGKAVYRARNALVHYRPAHQKMPIADYDWNEICAAMAVTVLLTYDSVL